MKRTNVKRAASKAVDRLLAGLLGMLLFVGSLGLGAVWLRHQIASSANELESLEGAMVEERRVLARLGAELARATSPGALMLKNRQLALGLAVPQERQIVLVRENVEARLLDKSFGGLSASFPDSRQ